TTASGTATRVVSRPNTTHCMLVRIRDEVVTPSAECVGAAATAGWDYGHAVGSLATLTPAGRAAGRGMRRCGVGRRVFVRCKNSTGGWRAAYPGDLVVASVAVACRRATSMIESTNNLSTDSAVSALMSAGTDSMESFTPSTSDMKPMAMAVGGTGGSMPARL